MDHYIVSARKYRPSTFATVIGQKPLTAALKHAVATDRLAHAYLFCGSRGVGKTSCARIFAKTINCRNRTPEGEACNECESCRAFNEQTSLNIIELDAASHNSVDDIKNLNEQVRVPPTQGRYRVFIIDEVHMLSSAAFNAFLKTLEEPPEYVVFILATTEKHKIIPTILSRCQIYDFSRITIQDMVEHLTSVAANEGITVDPAALNVIARQADGAMRDALSIFDQVAASTMGNVTYQNTIDNLNILDSSYYSRLVEAFLSNDVPAALLIYKEVRERGFDSQFFLSGMALYLRDLMVAQNPATLTLLEASDDVRAEMAGVAAKCSPAFFYKALDLCNDADLNFRVASNKQFLVELTLIKLCQLTAPAESPAPRTLKPVTPATSGPAPAAPAAGPAPQQQARQPEAPRYGTPQGVAQPQPKPYTDTRQPATGARPQTVGRRPSGMPSFSIHGSTQQPTEESKKSDSDDPSHRKAGPYTQEQLNEAWKKYAETHPSERILVNTMLGAPPTPLGDDKYAVEVDDNIQIDALNDARESILDFVRGSLGNYNIDFTVSIRQGEASPITWTNRDVLRHMVETHPQLTTLINDFNLSL